MFCLDLKFQRSTGKIQIHTLYIMMLYMLLLDIPLKWFKTDFYKFFEFSEDTKWGYAKYLPYAKNGRICYFHRPSAWVTVRLGLFEPSQSGWLQCSPKFSYWARPWVYLYQNFQVLHRGNIFLILHTYLSFCLQKNRVTTLLQCLFSVWHRRTRGKVLYRNFF